MKDFALLVLIFAALIIGASVLSDWIAEWLAEID